jgi:hypothetical protein
MRFIGSGFRLELRGICYLFVWEIIPPRTLRVLLELFDDLGLEGKAYRNASNRVQKLKPALQELIGVRLSTGFIASAKLEKTVDGKDYKIVVTKSPQQLLAFVAEDNDQAVQATPPAQPTSHRNYPGRLMPPMQSAVTALPRKG